MKKSRILTMLIVMALAITLLTVTASATPNEGWNGSDGWWSYYQNGEWVTDQVVKIDGLYYGFDSEGYMYQGESFWCNGNHYRATKAGNLLVNSWYEDADGEWYFYGEAGKAAYDFQEIGDDWYYFEYEGRMVSDEVVYSDQDAYRGYWAISKSGTASVPLNKAGWNSAFGKWYYMEDDGYGLQMYYGLLKLGSDWYYLDYNGQLITNDFVWCYDGENYIDGFADASGVLLKNTWGKKGNRWVYANSDRQIAWDGIYEIGGFLYLFRDGYLYDIPGENYYNGDIYVTTSGGSLKRNSWYYDNTRYDEPGWSYYGADGHRYHYGIYTIDGKTYSFNNSVLETECFSSNSGGTYWFDSNGVGTKLTDGWYQRDGDWYYVMDGRLAQGKQTINGLTYYFSGGRMSTNDYWRSYNEYLGEYRYYLYGGNGVQITTPGWHLVGGYYYLVQNDGSLREGWTADGNYYLTPTMRANQVFEDDGRWWAANKDGLCTELEGLGLINVWGRVAYINNNGSLATNCWKNVGGYYYYFGSGGYAYDGGVYEINGVKYLFDTYGKMHTGGWLNVYGDWYYAGADGIAYTGMKTIGGVQYLFRDSGYLYGTGCYTYNGNKYLLENGRVLCQLKNGWNQAGSNWYYMVDGYLVRDRMYTIGGVTYGFDYDGHMLTNEIYNERAFNASGAMIKGWALMNGRWIYADPEDGELYSWGYWEIDGKEYFFDSYYMRTGTFYGYDEIITTDSNGVITSVTDIPDGQIIYSDGEARLFKENAPYSGWMGDYFFENGYMAYNTIIEYNGAYYAIGPTGKCRYNSWYDLDADPEWEEYIYAKADGKLACHEWLKQGNTYYYFDHYNMVAGGVFYIDGAEHKFAEDGRWLGQYKGEAIEIPISGSGWKMYDGDWYYLSNGVPVWSEVLYIDGQWYGFDYTCKMVEKGFWDGFYFSAGGTRAEYTGWKYINGSWVFFNPDHSVATGLIKSGNGYYYVTYDEYYDEDTEEYGHEAYSLADAYMVVNGKLYYFDKTGFSSGALTGTGWYGKGSEWYYLKNGVLQTGYQTINGKGYFFDDEGYEYELGRMLSGTTVYLYEHEEHILLGADGARITKAGWHLIDGNWYCVDKDGFAYCSGIYMMQGSVYCFDYNGIWVEK